jgi:hypothetical protein
MRTTGRHLWTRMRGKASVSVLLVTSALSAKLRGHTCPAWPLGACRPFSTRPLAPAEYQLLAFRGSPDSWPLCLRWLESRCR